MKVVIRKSEAKHTFLIRYIFFAIFAVNIIGAFYFWKEENSPILYTVLIGIGAFIIGLFIGNIRLLRHKITFKSVFRKYTIEELKKNPNIARHVSTALLIVFIVAFVLSISLFLEKGIPLFQVNSNFARSTFGVGTWGRIRMLVTWCPMCALCFFSLAQIDAKYKRNAIIIMGIALVFLVFYSFKGNILWFIVMIYFVNTFMKGKLEFVKGFLYAGLAAILMLIVFSVWLSVDYSVAFDYLIKRVTQDEVDGLNYIITQYVPSIGLGYGEHFAYEFNTTVLSVYQESFGTVLATLYYGRRVTWELVQTFYGFLYLDFGNPGVFCGFLILGVIVRKLEISLEDIKSNTILSLTLKIYCVYILIKIVLVGGLFNEIKGLGLSALLFVVTYYVLAYFLVIKDDRKIVSK